jgi:hypothetical protein
LAENDKLARTIEKVREETAQQASLRELSARLNNKVDGPTAAISHRTEELEIKTRSL